MLRGAWLLSHVAFIAVDSSASVVGGRANWALPKQLAHFDGDPGRAAVVTARGEDWEVRVTATSRQTAARARAGSYSRSALDDPETSSARAPRRRSYDAKYARTASISWSNRLSITATKSDPPAGVTRNWREYSRKHRCGSFVTARTRYVAT